MPPRQAILSANDEYQLTAALLSNRKQRARQGRMLVQSVKAIESAIASEWVFDSVWTPRGRRLSAWAGSVIERSGARRHVELATDLFAQLSEKDEPGELVALVELRTHSLPELGLGPRPLVAVLDRPANPGNLGSIIRTADAFAADAVVVTGHAADLYDPQAVRASLGAIFAIPAVQHRAPAEVAEWLAGACTGLRIVGTSAKGGTENSSGSSSPARSRSCSGARPAGSAPAGASCATRSRRSRRTASRARSTSQARPRSSSTRRAASAGERPQREARRAHARPEAASRFARGSAYWSRWVSSALNA